VYFVFVASNARKKPYFLLLVSPICCNCVGSVWGVGLGVRVWVWEVYGLGLVGFKVWDLGFTV